MRMHLGRMPASALLALALAFLPACRVPDLALQTQEQPSVNLAVSVAMGTRATRSTQYADGAPNTPADVQGVVVALADFGNSQGRVLGRAISDTAGGGTSEGPLDEAWAQRVLDGPRGLAALAGTRQAANAGSVSRPADTGRRSRWLVRTMSAATFGTGRTVSFRNLPVPDGSGDHAYVLVATAWGQGRLLGYAEQAVADATLQAGGDASLPAMTIRLDEGLAGPSNLEIEPAPLPETRILAQPRISTWAGDAATAPKGAVPELDVAFGDITALHVTADGQVAVGTAAPGRLWVLGSTATQIDYTGAQLLGDNDASVRTIFDWPSAAFGVGFGYGDPASPPAPYQVLPYEGYPAAALTLNWSGGLRARITTANGVVANVHADHVFVEDPTNGAYVVGLAGTPGDQDDLPGTAGAARFRDLRGAVALSSRHLLVAEADRLRLIQLEATGGAVIGEVHGFGSRDSAGQAHAPIDIRGMARTREGWVVISDPAKGVVLRVDPDSGQLQPWAGSPRAAGAAPPTVQDGFFPDAVLGQPGPMAAAPGGGVFVADGTTVRWLR